MSKVLFGISTAIGLVALASIAIEPIFTGTPPEDWQLRYLGGGLMFAGGFTGLGYIGGKE